MYSSIQSRIHENNLKGKTKEGQFRVPIASILGNIFSFFFLNIEKGANRSDLTT